MSDFLSRAKKKQDGRQGPTCSIRLLLAAMDAEYRAEVEAAISDQTIRATVICEILKEDSIDMRPEPLQRHRRGQCACPKS